MFGAIVVIFHFSRCIFIICIKLKEEIFTINIFSNKKLIFYHHYHFCPHQYHNRRLRHHRCLRHHCCLHIANISTTTIVTATTPPSPSSPCSPHSQHLFHHHCCPRLHYTTAIIVSFAISQVALPPPPLSPPQPLYRQHLHASTTSITTTITSTTITCLCNWLYQTFMFKNFKT